MYYVVRGGEKQQYQRCIVVVAVLLWLCVEDITLITYIWWTGRHMNGTARDLVSMLENTANI